MNVAVKSQKVQRGDGERVRLDMTGCLDFSMMEMQKHGCSWMQDANLFLDPCHGWQTGHAKL